MTTDLPARPAPPVPVARAAGRRSLARHGELLQNALSLFNATMIDSALGFAFWLVAARLLPRSAVGYGSAATSAMTFLGTIGMFGMGSLLIGELPRLRPGGPPWRLRRRSPAWPAPACSGSRSCCWARSPGTPCGRWSGGRWAPRCSSSGSAHGGDAGPRPGDHRRAPRRAAAARNAVFAVAKLVLLVVAGWSRDTPDGTWILAAWVGGLAVSLLALAAWLHRDGTPLTPRPDWGRLRSLRRTAGHTTP